MSIDALVPDWSACLGCNQIRGQASVRAKELDISARLCHRSALPTRALQRCAAKRSKKGGFVHGRNDPSA